ncbi:hypothetical protein KEJ21_05725 [Candidatus Bathyarchaeota archaeon]|nr:hypothetical protein [Candidatus Bathyarchaeota archaeon]MBS7631462.1 hypothetical protein [Candidatus Bathyarchaeota archaeon]
MLIPRRDASERGIGSNNSRIPEALTGCTAVEYSTAFYFHKLKEAETA